MLTLEKFFLSLLIPGRLMMRPEELPRLLEGGRELLCLVFLSLELALEFLTISFKSLIKSFFLMTSDSP